MAISCLILKKNFSLIFTQNLTQHIMSKAPFWFNATPDDKIINIIGANGNTFPVFVNHLATTQQVGIDDSLSKNDAKKTTKNESKQDSSKNDAKQDSSKNESKQDSSN